MAWRMRSLGWVLSTALASKRVTWRPRPSLGLMGPYECQLPGLLMALEFAAPKLSLASDSNWPSPGAHSFKDTADSV